MRENGKIIKAVAAGLAFTLIFSMFPEQSLMAAPDETT